MQRETEKKQPIETCFHNPVSVFFVKTCAGLVHCYLMFCYVCTYILSGEGNQVCVSLSYIVWYTSVHSKYRDL